MIKYNFRRNIDTKFVYVKDEQVYILKKTTNNTFKETPVDIYWTPVAV